MKIKRLPMGLWMLAGFVLASGYLILNFNSVLTQFFWDEDDYAYVSVAVERDYPDYIFDREFYVQEFPRPVVHLYFWLIALFAGTVVWPYYLANLLLYAAGGVLLFRLVYKLSGSFSAGILAGAFYLASPCASDNLYWMAAGATGYVSGFLILLTANLYINAEEVNKPGKWFPVWLTAVLAMGAKESALSLPLLLTILEFSRGKFRKGWLKRLLPFYVILAFMATNIIFVQLSFPRNANFAKYGISWMILRNLLHFFVYPLSGALPPSTGEYTLVKMIVYPVLWILPLFFGPAKARKFVLIGFSWIFLSSLVFLQWKMDFEGLLPRICDIPSRYFNLSSMGSSLVVVGLFIMLRDRFEKRIAYVSVFLFVSVVAVAGVRWTHDNTESMISDGTMERCILDAALSSWNGEDTLYIGHFGLREIRIGFYNRMYFNNRLIQTDGFPVGVSSGTRMLCGPLMSPKLFLYENGEWSLEKYLSPSDYK